MTSDLTAARRALPAFALLLAACGSTDPAAGVYDIDKETMRRVLADNVAAGARTAGAAEAKATEAMVERAIAGMQGTLTLAADGTATMAMTAPIMGSVDSKGTWTRRGETVTCTMTTGSSTETFDATWKADAITIAKPGTELTVAFRRRP